MRRESGTELENAVAVSHCEKPEWLEIAIDAAPELNDPLSAFFFDLGCTGVVWEDFGNRTLKAYLPLAESPEDIQNRISIYLNDLSLVHPHLPLSGFTLTKVENQDWQQNWRRFFHPVRVTDRLLILPVWEKPAPRVENEHVIRIDPGPAFGTGQHATTKMCLQAMEAFGADESQALLDVGTGSGILAIYGVKLGFGNIEAIDVDPEAVRWAERNIRLNGATNAITLSSKGIEAINGRFSMVCANLILGELLHLMPVLTRLTEPHGRLVISGLLRNQVERINASRPSAELHHMETLYDEEWACMIFEKNP